MDNNFETNLVFYINGFKIEEKSPDPEMSLLSYLRLKMRLVGTKLGCGEGGCGACTVMVSKYDINSNKIRHYSVNACLAPVCAMHGLAVTTVEGIGDCRNRMHAVQERIVLAHGSQCGFCTPGIVMSMYTLLRQKAAIVSDEEIEDAFQGNLCRCTGYRPILQGFKSFATKSCCGNPEQCCKNNRKTSLTDSKEVIVESLTFDAQEFMPYDPSQEPIFPTDLQLNSEKYSSASLVYKGERVQWFRPISLQEVLQLKSTFPHAKIIVGNTEMGVECLLKNAFYPVYVCTTEVKELNDIKNFDNGIKVGASVTLSKLEEALKCEVSAAENKYSTQTFSALIEMLQWFAGPQIRNVAAIGGNIMTASPISDLLPLLLAAKCRLKFASLKQERTITLDSSFFQSYRKVAVQADEILCSIFIPKNLDNEYFAGYKQSQRREDDIAIVNAGMRVVFSSKTDITVTSLTLCFGGMAPYIVECKSVAEAAQNRQWNQELVGIVLNAMDKDLTLDISAPGGSVKYRRTLTASFFYRFFLDVCKKLDYTSKIVDEMEYSALGMIPRNISSGCQLFERVSFEQSENDFVGRPLVHQSARQQATGEAAYVDDMPWSVDELYMAPVFSCRAHARLLRVDATDAFQIKGVVGYIDKNDVQGTNNFTTTIAKDEVVFADNKVETHGQIIGCIVAESKDIAHRAAKKVYVEYEDLTPIISIEQAILQQSFFSTESLLKWGEPVADIFVKAAHVVEGEFWMGGQEHFYLETQAVRVVPKENGELEVFMAVQNPSLSQRIIADVTGLLHNRVVVRVKRMGGGFGGKETRGNQIAVPAAIAALKYKRSIRCMLNRDEDMAITGARHAMLTRYKAAANNDGKLLAVEFNFYLNAGYTEDMSLAVARVAVLKCINSYFVPNGLINATICKTNISSNTAFRGFGAPQSIAAMETMLTHLADAVKMSNMEIREINFLCNGDIKPYGFAIQNCTIRKCWEECKTISDFMNRRTQIQYFNNTNRWKKKGIWIAPLTYGCSFEERFLNQGGALIHVYLDGSILLNHGGTEMGQGLHTKMIQIVSRELGVHPQYIFVSETSTDKVPNTMSTAASFSTDINGQAVMDACRKLSNQLEPFRKGVSWKEAVNAAYMSGVSLSANGYYHDKLINFSWETQRGRPFAYYSYGAACADVEIDCLTGDHVVHRVDLIMDVGKSINPSIDIGQIEGGFIQGYGLHTLEQQRYSPNGFLYSRGPGTYKIPGFKDIPEQFNVHILKNSNCEYQQSVYSSKAIGEPPLCLAQCIFFAIREAVAAARQESGVTSSYFRFDSPASAERIRLACADDFVQRYSLDEEEEQKPTWDIRL